MIRRALLLACTARLACATPASADPVTLRDSVPHITVTGQASTEVVPDRADLRLGIGSERPTAEAAAAVTAERAATVIEAIKAQGIAAADIKSSFSLAAQYDSATDPKTHVTHRTLRGYAANVRITVRVRDVPKAGDLARTLIDKGANSFQDVDYAYAEEEALRRRLDGEAANEGRGDGGEGLHRRARPQARPGAADRGDATSALPAARFAGGSIAEPPNSVAIPTEPGTQTFTRSATVTFEIEGKAQ